MSIRMNIVSSQRDEASSQKASHRNEYMRKLRKQLGEMIEMLDRIPERQRSKLGQGIFEDMMTKNIKSVVKMKTSYGKC